jgi:hypothetical protein
MISLNILICLLLHCHPGLPSPNITPALDPLALPFQPAAPAAGGLVSADDKDKIGYSEDEADRNGDKVMADK